MPNPLNYGTQPACQRLVDNGIVLETEAVWCKTHRGWRLHLKSKAKMYKWLEVVPAVSLAEVWRELPKWTGIIHLNGTSYAQYKQNIEFESDNPTDALIDLLIWVRGQKGKEG